MHKHIQKMILVVAAAMFAAAPLFTADARPMRSTNGPKYVFFFLGDGMANVQMQAAEAYLTEVVNGGDHDNSEDMRTPENILNMNKFPYQGMATTFAETRLITGSAAAGTAFAAGSKTDIGFIGMTSAPDYTPLKSLANLAQEQGRKVGVISSVSIDHATPASYYANVDYRSNYRMVAAQLPQSGFNFFGGGGFKRQEDAEETDHNGAHMPYEDYTGIVGATIDDVLTHGGYTKLDTRADIMALQTTPQDKVVCINPTLMGGSAMPYTVDQDEQAGDGLENVTLPEFTETAIACLEDDPDGFFLAVEGGKIDWACHANDAMAAIGNTLAFDKAIGKAIEFYNEHPNDTLIVVTGDHECGGLTIGFANTGYASAFDVLGNQGISYEYFNNNVWPGYKKTQVDIDTEFKTILNDNFGLVWADLNDYEKERLEAAFDKSISGTSANTTEEDDRLYGYYEPITVTITHILNERAGIGWTSYSHTSVPVPVLALGFDAWRFDGFYDNTDIAKKVAAAMRLSGLPISK